jgi:hypothetical protein
MIGILPAAGTATRLGGLPKFLLPVTSSEDTLLRRHIEALRGSVDQVLIPTRPENAMLIAPYIDDLVTVLVMETQTMSETVCRALSWVDGSGFLLGMPDTFFTRSNPYLKIAESLSPGIDMVLAAWAIAPDQRGQLGQIDISANGNVLDSVDKDPECTFRYFWGAMGFQKRVLADIDPGTAHVGYSIRSLLDRGGNVLAVVQEGRYIDSGTPQGFRFVLEEAFEISRSTLTHERAEEPVV